MNGVDNIRSILFCGNEFNINDFNQYAFNAMNLATYLARQNDIRQMDCLRLNCSLFVSEYIQKKKFLSYLKRMVLTTGDIYEMILFEFKTHKFSICRRNHENELV